MTRLDWADLARAVAIVLVVLYHVGNVWLGLVVSDPGAIGWYVQQLNDLLLPVRMPLFFLISGMLAVRALERRWAQVRRPRVLDMLWPFAIWSVAVAPFWALEYGLGWNGVVTALSWIPLLTGGYWYLPALVVFFLVTWIVGRYRWILLAVATAVWLFAPLFASTILALPAGKTLYPLMLNLVWFVAGATLPAVLKRLAAAPVALTLVVSVGWGVLAVADLKSSAWAVTPLVSLFGVTAAVMLCGAAVRLPGVSRIGRYLGSRTLSIYLMHPILLAALVIVLPQWPGSELLTLTLIIAAMVLSVLGPAVLRSYLPDWLFQLPGAAKPSGQPRAVDADAPHPRRGGDAVTGWRLLRPRSRDRARAMPANRLEGPVDDVPQ